MAAVSDSLLLNVLSAPPVLNSDDSDGDGVNDNVEGYGDEDGDGIADYLDAVPAGHILQQQTAVSDGFLMETEPGVKLSLGEIAFKANRGRTLVTQTEILDYSSVINLAQDSIENTGGYFDVTVSGLPSAGQPAEQ